jgi:hypothetical protein
MTAPRRVVPPALVTIRGEARYGQEPWDRVLQSLRPGRVAPEEFLHRLGSVPAPRSANSTNPARMISIPIWLSLSGKSPNTERS